VDNDLLFGFNLTDVSEEPACALFEVEKFANTSSDLKM